MGGYGKGEKGKGGKGGGYGEGGKGGKGGGKGGKGGKGGFDGGKGGYDGGKGKGGFKGGGKGGGKGASKEMPHHIVRAMPSIEELTTCMKDMSMTKVMQEGTTVMPFRKPGRIGAAVKLNVNLFPVRSKLQAVYQYDVDIRSSDTRMTKEGTASEDLASSIDTSLTRWVMQQVAEANNWRSEWAYDGRKYLLGSRSLIPEDSGGLSQKVVLGGQRSRPSSSSRGGNRTKWEHVFADRPCEFQVVIAFTQVIDMRLLQEYLQGTIPNDTNVQDRRQAMDIILKHSAGMRQSWWVFGRSNNLMFPPQAGHGASIGGGVELWYGYTQTFRTCQSGLAVCLAPSATGFIMEGPVEELLRREYIVRDLNSQTILDQRQSRTLTKILKNVKINLTHMQHKRSMSCKGVGKLPATKAMFDKDGTQMSVAAYFQQEKGIRLKYPNLPCLILGTKGNLFPIEVCEVASGQRKGKLDGDQTAKLIRSACVRPEDTMGAVKENMNTSELTNDPTARAFGLEISNQMMQVNARVVPSPLIQYANTTVTPQTGGWNLKDQAVKMLDPRTLRNWAVVCMLTKMEAHEHADPQGKLVDFYNDFKQVLDKAGMMVNPPSLIVYWQQGQSVRQAMTQAAQAMQQRQQQLKCPPQLTLVVLRDKDAGTYAEVKHHSDVVLGIPSQCLVAENAGVGQFKRNYQVRSRLQYCGNVALKVNVKLGGTNSTIVAANGPQYNMSNPSSALSWLADDFQSKPFMLLGADVTHSIVSSENARSIAAVVGSMDKNASRFATKVMVQPGVQNNEMIAGLAGAVSELLVEFYRTTRGKRPERLVMYRDGVSDEQFTQVLTEELPQIKKACMSLGDGSYCPPITLLVVKKRHHTRLFAANDNEKMHSGNILPGTVVDTDICEPHQFDFFLNSHEGLQGTNRPTHYHVLIDENGFTADTLQILTYRLCYMYCRATKAVSIPPPAYYAHLAAYRGRILLAGGDSSDSDSESTSSGVSRSRQAPAEDGPVLQELHPNMKSTMFYV